MENLQEHIAERAHESEERWISRVALSTAILAAFAAVAALLAGGHVNEAMIAQIQSSDSWAFYQAKSIKAGVLGAKVDLLKAQGLAVTPADVEKLKGYGEDQDAIKEKAEEKERDSEAHLRTHESFARAVTMFQIAIAIAAIAVLTKRQHFWFCGLLFGAAGVVFFVLAFLPHKS